MSSVIDGHICCDLLALNGLGALCWAVFSGGKLGHGLPIVYIICIDQMDLNSP